MTSDQEAGTNKALALMPQNLELVEVGGQIWIGDKSPSHEVTYEPMDNQSQCVPTAPWMEYKPASPIEKIAPEKYLSKSKTNIRLTLQGRVYNFLERPTGWKCFIYHFTV